MKIKKGDLVLFTAEILKATLDSNGNTPFTDDDIGSVFVVDCIYKSDDSYNVHLQETGHKACMITRSLHIDVVLAGKQALLDSMTST